MTQWNVSFRVGEFRVRERHSDVRFNYNSENKFDEHCTFSEF